MPDAEYRKWIETSLSWIRPWLHSWKGCSASVKVDSVTARAIQDRSERCIVKYLPFSACFHLASGAEYLYLLQWLLSTYELCWSLQLECSDPYICRMTELHVPTLRYDSLRIHRDACCFGYRPPSVADVRHSAAFEIGPMLSAVAQRRRSA